MNISGILVVVSPAELDKSITALNGLSGVEVHHSDARRGRIVVTQEADSIREETEGLKRIKALPGVVMAEMVYHFFEEDQEIIDAFPPELDEGEAQLNIPPYLNE